MTSLFTVQSVIERIGISPSGNLKPVTTIYMTTMLGATGSLEIPQDQYIALVSTDEGKAALRNMLQERADALDAPFNL